MHMRETAARLPPMASKKFAMSISCNSEPTEERVGGVRSNTSLTISLGRSMVCVYGVLSFHSNWCVFVCVCVCVFVRKCVRVVSSRHLDPGQDVA